MDGFFVGVGVEQAFNRNLSLKLDYRFSDYGNYSFNSDVKMKNEVHSVRLGVNYRFSQ